MRCPKCSYISFDHLAACAKCSHDLSELVTQLQGTAIEVEMPFFLGAALGSLGDETSEGLLISDEIDTEPLMEDVDFQMEPDFELAGEATEAAEIVDSQLDAVEEAAEEEVDFQLEAAEEAAEEEVDFQLDAAEEAAEEEVDFQLDAADDAGEAVVHETALAEETPSVAEQGSIDTDELLDTTLADLDDFDLGDMDINLDKDIDDLAMGEPFPEEETFGGDDELSTTDLDEMFAGLDFDDQKDDEVEPTISGDETLEKGFDIGDLTLESEGEEEKPRAVSDLDLTLEVDDV